jgi:transcriptional regulator with XRE-family HTH domain
VEDKHIKYFLNNFGRHLATKRREKGISQETLAFEAGLDVMTISRIERGILSISIGNAYKIAIALNIPYKDLFDFDLPTTNKK